MTSKENMISEDPPIKKVVSVSGNKNFISVIASDQCDPNHYIDETAWDALSHIADELPPSGRDWEPIGNTKLEKADLDYAVHLGLLEAMTGAKMEIRQKKEGDKNLEVVLYFLGGWTFDINRSLPMYYITVDIGPEQREDFGVKSIEFDKETDDYLYLKIKKGDWP